MTSDVSWVLYTHLESADRSEALPSRISEYSCRIGDIVAVADSSIISIFNHHSRVAFFYLLLKLLLFIL